MLSISKISGLLLPVWCLLAASPAIAQDTTFKRWHYTKDGRDFKFTAKFEGLSEENAVFSNRAGKLAEIPLEQLSRQALEDLIVMFAPAASAEDTSGGKDATTAGASGNDAPEADVANGDAPRWKVKLIKDFTKAVDEIERFRTKLYKGSEKWTSVKFEQKSREFASKVSSYSLSFDFPAEIVSISKSKLRNRQSYHEVTISIAEVGEWYLHLSKYTQYEINKDLKIAQLFPRDRKDVPKVPSGKRIHEDTTDADVGTKVKVTCSGLVWLKEGDPRGFRNRTLNLPKVLESGITREDRTYNLAISGVYIE